MKRWLSCMLALVLCLSVSMSAAQGDILPEKEGYRALVSAVRAGDALYVLTISGYEAHLLCWKEGMSRAEVVADDLVNAAFFNTREQIEEQLAGTAGADPAHAVSFLFSDGEQLYGFNSVERLAFAMDVTEDGLIYTDVAVLPAVENRSFVQPLKVVRSGDWLLWLETDQNSRFYTERLLAFNLEAGTVKQAVLPDMCDIAAYKDGKVLVLCETEYAQEEPYAIYTYHPATDVAECIGMLPKGTSVRKIDYSAALDMAVYQNRTRIMGWTEENGPEQIGFIPTSGYADLMLVGDQLLYSPDRSAIEVAPVRRGYSTDHSLTLMGGTMSTVLSRFYMRYLDVPVYHADRLPDETYAEVFDREVECPDLVYLSATTGEYTELLEAGKLMDLSQFADIKEYIDLLHPAYQEVVRRGNAIYGVPMSAYSYNGWYINKAVMKDMGLTVEDIPTTLTGMCAFATRWNNEFAEKYPHYTLLNETEHYRERMMEVILEKWADYCQYNHQPLRLDDPIFRELLAALEAMQVDKLDAALRQTNPEVSEYKQALIWTGCKDVGNWACYMEEYSDRIFIPLKLTAETPYIAPVEEMNLWVVNARSQNAEYAAALLDEAVEKIPDYHAYVLRTDKTEPVVDEYYEAVIAEAQESLRALEESLEDSVNRATIEKRIEEQKKYIEEELARNKYDVFPSAIENYRSVIAPASFVSASNALDVERQTEQMAQAIDDYLKGLKTADVFILLMDMLIEQGE